MENITNVLKQARIDKGLTIDETVQKTKFTKAQIMAIEEGRLDFFQSDLSYFGYMIRYYCRALDVDYEELRKDVEAIVANDVFTQEIEAIRKSAHVDTKVTDKKPIQPTRLKRTKRKIDYSFAAFLTTSILLIIILAYVGIKYVPSWFKEEPIKKPGLIVEPKPNDKDDEKEDESDNPPLKEEDETSTFTILPTQDPHKYEITGWEETDQIEIKVLFKAPATWISASVNNAVLSDPLSTTYLEGEEIVVLEDASENKEFMFHMGKMLGNEFYINGQKVELDETVQKSSGVAKLYFKLIKDGAVD